MSALDHQVGGTNHYRHGKIQPVQYIEANKLQFLEGCVVKRVTRHDKPGGKGKQDIEKAIHELQLLLEQRYAAPEFLGTRGPIGKGKTATMPPLPGDHPQPVYENVERPAKVAEPDADGWIVWGGGECPVVAMTRIDVRYRDGKEARNIPALAHHGISGTRNATDWSQSGRQSEADIVAYRLVQNEPQWPMVSEPGDHSKIKAAYRPGMEWTSAFEGSEFLGGWNGDSPIWEKKYRYAIRPAQGAQA